MGKFLDQTGIKYLWGRIVDTINNSINNSISPGGGGKFPKIRILGFNQYHELFGCYSDYYVENGDAYIKQGYVPMLFTKRAVRKHYRAGRDKFNNYGDGEFLTKPVHFSKSAEWRRCADVFVNIIPEGYTKPEYPKNLLAFFRSVSRAIHGDPLHNCDYHFGTVFFYHKALLNVDVYNGYATRNLGALLVPECIYSMNGNYVYVPYYIYNNKLIKSYDPWLDHEKGEIDLTIPDSLCRTRHLSFDFKFCFVKNKWYREGFYNEHDPREMLGCYLDSLKSTNVIFYDKQVGIGTISRAKFTLDDAVSNIIDINVKVTPRDRLFWADSGYYTKYKVNIIN